MKNIIDYLKDKIYYIMAATILIIVILVIVSACSGSSNNTYEQIEANMVSAAKKYYSSKKEKLPKEENGSVKVTIGTLVETELLDEIYDPKDKTNKCSGNVEVTKVGDEYSYVPFLTCKGNYEPEYLKDIVINSGVDEYGNGIYQMDGDYVYRGDDVNNYVKFNEQLWRIIRVKEDGSIKLILANSTQEVYTWDTKYNSESKRNSGNTSDYLLTDIRKSLNEYYDNTFTSNNKSKIISKNICIGSYLLTDSFNVEKECSVIKENEKISLLNASDYKEASLDSGCTNLNSRECENRNYLSSDEITTWLLNASSENTYKVMYLYDYIDDSYANNTKKINPVIYLSYKVVISYGNGTMENPYIVK